MMVLVVRSGGAAAAAALRGAPGAASRGFFLFLAGAPLGAAAAGERRGAGVWPGLAARDGKKSTPACRAGLGG